jgi:SAM-dependent methyltransferase
LEVGSGAGRFTEILLSAGARVVSFDYSIAADANLANNEAKGDLFLFQGTVYSMPLAPASFDFVFCYGVLQHTPDPTRTYREMFDMLRPGGRLSMDAYRKIPLSKIWPHAKYSWRPLTTRTNPRLLLAIISAYMPFWQPVDTWIRHLPRGIGGKILWRLPIPCWNYVDQFQLSKQDLVRWAIMDTFDALAARYDFPQTLETIEAMVRATNVDDADVFYGSNGIVANVRRPDTTR